MPKSTSYKRHKLAVDNGAGRMSSDQHYAVMLSLIGLCEGGPIDLADRHDQYPVKA